MLQLRSALVLRLIPAFLLIGTLSCNSSTPTAPSGSQSPPTTSPGPGSTSPTLASLTLTETEVDGGDSVAGTATLSAAAPAGGIVVTLTSSGEAASVPASINIAAGATSGTFTVMTETVPFAVDVTITGAAGGASRTATLDIEPAPGDGPIQSVDVQSDDVVGGDDAPGTITLSAPAPAGGARLALSSSDPDLIVPASVTVPAGSTSATFPIETRPVTVAKTVGVTVALAPVAARKTSGVAAAGASSYTFLIKLLPQPADAPTLTAVAPSTGVQGANVAVTLTGTNFIDGATVAVSGAGITVSNVVVASATSITATFAIDAGAATGARDVTVTTAGGTSGAQTFTIEAAAPTLTGLTPSIGAEGAEVDVTLTGTNFVDGATVTVSDASITVSDVVVASATSITATFIVDDCADLGARTVTVTTEGGTSGGQTFTVVGPPTLSGISPDTGERASTVSVTLTGTNFLDGATVSVSGDGVTVEDVTVVSDTSITADFVIDGTTDLGERDVTVTTVAGTSGAQGFTIKQPSGEMTFDYTGASQTFTVPEGVTSIEVDVSGAQGGRGEQQGTGTAGEGGLGAQVVATLEVTPGEELTIFVGGKGADEGAGNADGGFNGGGNGGSAAAGPEGGGGGGASDVRRDADKLVIAGGGGGGGSVEDFPHAGGNGGDGGTTGGVGGAATGGDGGGGGGGATQGAGGASGINFSGENGTAGVLNLGGAGGAIALGLGRPGGGGGGGGGYYGGGGGASGTTDLGGAGGGGGGGSSFAADSATSVDTTNGVRTGHGVVIIRWYALPR